MEQDVAKEEERQRYGIDLIKHEAILAWGETAWTNLQDDFAAVVPPEEKVGSDAYEMMFMMFILGHFNMFNPQSRFNINYGGREDAAKTESSDN